MTSSSRIVESIPKENAKGSEIPEIIARQLEQTAPVADDATEENNDTDFSVYWHHFTSIGLFNMIPFLLLAAAFGFFYNFPLGWLSWWSEANNNNTMYLKVYSVFQILGLPSVTLLAQHGLNTMAKKSSQNLHLRLLKSTIFAPLSFFHKTDAGSIPHRSSQDVLLIDTELPNALMNIAALAFMMIGQAIIIAVAWPYLAIVCPALMAVLYYIQKCYSRTSRQLRLLDLDAKSPLY